MGLSSPFLLIKYHTLNVAEIDCNSIAAVFKFLTAGHSTAVVTHFDLPGNVFNKLQRYNSSTIESTEPTSCTIYYGFITCYLVRYPELCCDIAIQETSMPSEMYAGEHVSLMGHMHP